jgi:hypothetical protein
MADELVDRLVSLVVFRRFHGKDRADSRALNFDSYVRMHHVVRRSTYVPFQQFWGICGENSCNVCVLLFMVLWAHVFEMLCSKATPMLRHASIFLGLRHVCRNRERIVTRR